MDMKLELVFVPVSDIDRAKAFYVERIGFKRIMMFGRVTQSELFN